MSHQSSSSTALSSRRVPSQPNRRIGLFCAVLTAGLAVLLPGCSGDESPRDHSVESSEKKSDSSPELLQTSEPFSSDASVKDASDDTPAVLHTERTSVSCGGQPSQGVPDDSLQLLLVTTTGWRTNEGRLRLYRRQSCSAPWSLSISGQSSIRIRLGRAGLAWGRGLHPNGLPGPVKSEGDQRSPAGIFDLGEARGFAWKPPPGTTWPFVHTGPHWRCMDDDKSPAYNTFISTMGMPLPVHAGRARREDLFHWMIFVLHNTNPVERGAGSCVFLHVWASPSSPTQGCFAMSRSDLASVLRWLRLERRPVLAVLPASEWKRYAAPWHLPTPDLASPAPDETD